MRICKKSIRFAPLGVLAAVLFSAILRAQTATPANAVPKPMAREVMYRLLFHQIVSVQKAADQRAAQSKPLGSLPTYFRTRLQLTAAQDLKLKQVAADCVQQMSVLDAQANAIIRAIKKQHAGAPKGSPDAKLPPPPPLLAELEAQRTALVLSAADTLATAYGPAQVVYFESLARRLIGNDYKVVGVNGQRQ